MHCLEIYGSTISWPSPFYDLYNILIFLNSTTYEQSVDADGFGVCFEMGKKCCWITEILKSKQKKLEVGDMYCAAGATK